MARVICIIRISHPAMRWLNSTAGEHYSVSDKEEKVDGYNHSFTRCGCMHISHIHLLDNQVNFAHFCCFISMLGHVWFSHDVNLFCNYGVLVKNLKIKNISIVYSKFYPCLRSLDEVIKMFSYFRDATHTVQPSVSLIL